MKPERYRRMPGHVGPAYARPVPDPKPSRESGEARSDLPTGVVTWATLLARWTALVKAGEGLVLASPGDPEARRWRESIPEVVTLQSVTFALGDLESLALIDRSIARDRADIAVTESSARLDAIWHGVQMPAALLEIASDARRTVEISVYAGLQWLVNTGSTPWRMPKVDLGPEEPIGTLALMQPGTLALPGSPVAWWAERPLPPALEASVVGEGKALGVWRGPPVQVYRGLDDAGRIEGDLVETLDALPVGLPLLVPICLDGERIGRFTVDPVAWAASNDAALDGVNPFPTVSFGDFEVSRPE